MIFFIFFKFNNKILYSSREFFLKIINIIIIIKKKINIIESNKAKLNWNCGIYNIYNNYIFKKNFIFFVIYLA